MKFFCNFLFSFFFCIRFFASSQPFDFASLNLTEKPDARKQSVAERSRVEKNFIELNKRNVSEKSEKISGARLDVLKKENNDLLKKNVELDKKNLYSSNKLKKYSTTHRSSVPSSLHSFSPDNSFSQILESSQDDDNKLVGLENVTDLIDLEDQVSELTCENESLKKKLDSYQNKICELEEVINYQDIFINDYENKNNERESSLKEYVEEFSRELHQIRNEESSKNYELCEELKKKNSLVAELEATIKKLENQAEINNVLIAELQKQKKENLNKLLIEEQSLDFQKQEQQKIELDQKNNISSDDLELQLPGNEEKQNDLGFEAARPKRYPTRLAEDIGGQTDRSLTDSNFNFYGCLKIEFQDVSIQTDPIVISQKVSDEMIGSSKKSQKQEKHLQDYYFLKKGTLIRFASISVLSVLFFLFIFRNKTKNFICFYYPVL